MSNETDSMKDAGVYYSIIDVPTDATRKGLMSFPIGAIIKKTESSFEVAERIRSQPPLRYLFRIPVGCKNPDIRYDLLTGEMKNYHESKAN